MALIRFQRIYTINIIIDFISCKVDYQVLTQSNNINLFYVFWGFINQSIIFILINHIQRYREDINIHITNTEIDINIYTVYTTKTWVWDSLENKRFIYISYIVTVCVFVRHLFSWYPFYFDFHIARIIFDVSSGFYLWNINNTKVDICNKWSSLLLKT